MSYRIKFISLGLISLFLFCAGKVFPQNPPLQNTSENIQTFWDTRMYPDFNWQKVSDAGSAYQGQFTGGATSLNCPNTPTWNSLGPFGSLGAPTNGTSGAGRVMFVRFHPNYNGGTNKIMYCGGASGGLWKSIDGGLSWAVMPIDKQMMWLNASDLAINPNNTNEMWLSTGHFQFNFLSGGLYHSTDGGLTWSLVTVDLGNGAQIGFLQPAAVQRIQYHPTIPNFLMMTVFNGVNHTGGKGWIVKSTDNGASWSVKKHFPGWQGNLNAPIADVNCVYDFEFHPTNPDVIYSMGHFFWRSTDMGETWMRTDLIGDDRYHIDELVAIGKFPTLCQSRVSITKASNRYDRVYLFRLTNQSVTNPNDHTTTWYYFLDLYVSNDRGITFDYIALNPSLYTIGFGSHQMHIGLGVDNETGNKIYVGSANYHEVTYNPQPPNHFIDIGQIGGYGVANTHADLKDVQPDPVDHNKIWFTSDGGVHEYSRSGSPQTWQDRSSGLSITQFFRLGVSCTPDLQVAAGALDNGTGLYENQSWRKVGWGDGYESAISCDGFIYISENSIVSYEGGPYIGSGSNNASVFIFDPDEPKNIYLGQSDGVYFSNNHLQRNRLVNSPNITVRVLAIGKSSPTNAYLYCCSHSDNGSGNLYYSRNNGNTWGLYPLPHNRNVTAISVDPVDPLKLWITFSGYDDGKKVYYSTDGGGTWSNVTANLPNLPCNTIIIDKTSPFKTIYVGMDVGVYYRHFGIVNSEWQCFTGSLPNTVVNELDIHYPTRQLVAATFGRGIWATGLACFPYPENLYSHNASPNRLGTQVVQNRIIGARINQGQPANLTFSVGETAEYVAGDMIEFMPGFEAVVGSNLIARIDAALECSTSPVISPRIESPYTIGSNFKKTNTGDVHYCTLILKFTFFPSEAVLNLFSDFLHKYESIVYGSKFDDVLILS